MREFPVYKRAPISIVRGEGYQVYDDAGREYLDLYGGHAVACLGYGHPAYTAALSAQLARLHFQSNAVESVARVEALDAIGRIAPAGLDRVFFTNSGAESNENALRMACRATGRRVVVTLSGGFHGRTAASAAATDGALASWYGFPDTPFEVRTVAANDVSALAQALTSDVAAFIFEPIQGVAGAVCIIPDFAQMARNLCDQHGILMIADEVQSGAGRSGDWWAVTALGIVPDILTSAKSIAGGFPAGLILADADLADSLPIGALGTTFGGSPLAACAIATTIRVIESEGLLANVTGRSEEIWARAQDFGSVQGRGFLLGLRVNGLAGPVIARLREHGIIVGDAKDPHIVRLLPPYILDTAAVATFFHAWEVANHESIPVTA